MPPMDEMVPHEHDGSRLPEMSAALVDRTADLLRAAGEPARLRLLALLSEGERCVSELVGAGENLSTVSQRLRVLRSVHLVTRRRDGKHVYYSLADDHIVDLIRSALRHAEEPLPPESQEP